MATEITDSQLIRQLESFGEKITVKIPLTEIKRGVLVKKLNHLRIRGRVNNVSRKSQPASTRFDQIAAYSSDESDIGDESSTVSARRSRLSTRSSRHRSGGDGDFKIPNRPALRSRNSGQFSAQIDNDSNTDTARKTVITKTTDIKHKKDEKVPQSSGSLFSRFKRSSGRSPLRNSSHDSDPSMDASDTDVDDSDGGLYQVENKSINTSFPFNASLEISLAGGPERQSGYWNRVASPILTKTLLPGKTSTPSVFPHSNNRTNNDSISLSSSPGVNHVVSWAESKPPKPHVNKQYKGAKTHSELHDKFGYSHYISKVLVVIAVLFFIVVGLLYVGIHHSYSGVDTKSENNWLICPHRGSTSSYCKEGYDQTLVKHAFAAISPLYDLLSTRLGDFDCGLSSSPNMSVEELKQFIKVALPQKPFEVSKVVLVVLDLIIHNEHWNLRALTGNGETAQHKDVAMTVVCTEASRQLMCRVQQAMQKVFTQLMFWGSVIVASVALIGGVLIYIRFHLRKLEEQQKEVYNIVEKILDILKQHAEHCEENNAEPYLPIQHIRDMIIPPAKRKILLPIWERAVLFIASHESRIRVENQCIQGEEFLVWRWLQSFPNGGKVWQGQAFGEHEIGANSPPYSPTQCLKIRNMFDADVEEDDTFTTNVQDAILEKCDEAAIVHVLVDKRSKEGCVYLKCTDSTEAGKAYKCLHGWWFDGKLVTVKYLRLEHYHDRFPDSVSSVNPLTPSTDRNLSLSQPYHRSSLEMT